MDRELVRLECIKLRNRYDRGGLSAIIAEAKQIEEYVMGDDNVSAKEEKSNTAAEKVEISIPKKKRGRKKKEGTQDPFL